MIRDCIFERKLSFQPEKIILLFMLNFSFAVHLVVLVFILATSSRVWKVFNNIFFTSFSTFLFTSSQSSTYFSTNDGWEAFQRLRKKEQLLWNNFGDFYCSFWVVLFGRHNLFQLTNFAQAPDKREIPTRNCCNLFFIAMKRSAQPTPGRFSRLYTFILYNFKTLFHIFISFIPQTLHPRHQSSIQSVLRRHRQRSHLQNRPVHAQRRVEVNVARHFRDCTERADSDDANQPEA